MSERDTIDCARNPDEKRMRQLLDEIGGIKYVVADNVVLRNHNSRLRDETDALAAELAAVKESRERLRHALLIAQGDADPESIDNYQPLRDSDWRDLAAPDGEGE